jgi:hypothetical protein
MRRAAVEAIAGSTGARPGRTPAARRHGGTEIIVAHGGPGVMRDRASGNTGALATARVEP